MMPQHPWVPQLQQPGVLCLTNVQTTQQSAGRWGLDGVLPE